MSYIYTYKQLKFKKKTDTPLYMSVLIKNESRSSSLKISISQLFNGSPLYTTTLQPQQSSRIPIKDLKDNSKGLNPGAVLLSVQTLKKNFIWKGPIPISSNSTPIKINPQTKTVFYGETPIPSLVSSSPGFPIGLLCLALLIGLLWILFIRSNNKR